MLLADARLGRWAMNQTSTAGIKQSFGRIGEGDTTHRQSTPAPCAGAGAGADADADLVLWWVRRQTTYQ